MTVYKAALCSTFGRRWLPRLFLLACGAIIVGILGYIVVGNASLPRLQSTLPYALGGVFIIQLSLLFALVASSGILRYSQDTLSRLLRILPTTTTTRWLVHLLPALVITGLTLVCVTPAITSLLVSASISPLSIFAVLTAGTTSALGLFYALPKHYLLAHLLLVPAVLWAEYALLHTLTNALLIETAQSASWRFIYLQVVLGAVFIYSATYVNCTVPLRLVGKRPLLIFLPTTWWYVKKMLRGTTTRTGLLAALGISTGIALTLAQQPVVDRSFLIFIAALLLASFASDARALSRRYTPAEIANLRGTAAFIRIQAASTLPIGLIAVLPLLFVSAPSSWLELGSTISQLLVGGAIGLFSGLLIMPQKRDIGGQFLASLLCIGLLYCIPQLTFIASLEVPARICADCFIALALGWIGYGIEQKRNNYLWKEN